MKTAVETKKVVDEAGIKKPKDFPRSIIYKVTKPTNGKIPHQDYDHEVIIMTALDADWYLKEYYPPDQVKDEVTGNPRRTKTVKLPVFLLATGEDGVKRGEPFTTTADLWKFLLTAEGGYKKLEIPKHSNSSTTQQKPRKKRDWGI